MKEYLCAVCNKKTNKREEFANDDLCASCYNCFAHTASYMYIKWFDETRHNDKSFVEWFQDITGKDNGKL
jgi:hypothetical protein